MSSRRAVSVVHWIATVAFVLPMAWSAVQYLTEAPKMVETMTVHLGYPMYFLTILGVAKLLGCAALLVNRPVRLKEWAYAGFTFDLLGAFLSHMAVDDPLSRALIPIGFLVLLAVSYAAWRRGPRWHRAPG
jgi:uncharacterized membrane protein YphA (DoxX/SURF4 family)